ncbi:hypothetical protein [Methylocella sp.]|uniref:hypothetical protein n=1 Tax=Methylocella sp. TaxID=1978226 RepID=UPI0037844446
MIALLLPALNALFGGLIRPFVKAWTDFERAKLAANVEGFSAAAEADAKIMQAAFANDAAVNALKAESRGEPLNRLIMLVAGVPPAVHFGLVFLDTILASRFLFGAPGPLGVPRLPRPYDTFEWAIVSSFFLVHAASLGVSNVTAWLGRKGA